MDFEFNLPNLYFTEKCRETIYRLAEPITEEIEKYPEFIQQIAYNCLYTAIQKTVSKFCNKPAKVRTERVFAYLRLEYVGLLY